MRPSIILADLLGNRSLLQQVQKVMVCDLWLVYFDLFCVFLTLCFKVRCFWTSECVFSCFRSFSSQFLYLLTKIRQVASLDSKGENSASKSRRNTDMGGWKRIDTFPTTFNFAASAHYCHFYLTGRIGCYRNGLIKVKEKPKILKRVGQHRLWVIQNSCKMMNK